MKHSILASLFVFLISGALLAQSGDAMSFSIQVKDCHDNPGRMLDDVNELKAQFTVDKNYGPAPLTVQFTDRSSSDATRWLWRFGDGDTTMQQNPTHTFQQEGIYNVRLFVWDADTSNVSNISKEIRVVGYGVCDSLNYRIPGSYYLYQLAPPETGYLSGNNSRGDLAKASYFEVNEEKGMLMGGLFYFAHKTSTLVTDPQIVFKAWGNDGTAGGPGTMLDSSTVLLSGIRISEIQGDFPSTVVFFDNWVPISDDFFMGVELPSGAGDTVALFTNKINATTNGNAWEQMASGEWQTYKQGDPQYDVDHAIYPLICQSTGIDNYILEQDVIIYPIPATDRIYISIFKEELKDVKITIIDVSGRLVVETKPNISNGSSIDVSHLSNGIYVLRLHTNNGVFNRKIMIEK